MSQITSGIRSILSHPRIYDAFLSVIGSHGLRRRVVRDYFDCSPGTRILDFGCGTANILRHLPNDIEYFGIDLSQEYIDKARELWGNRGRFECVSVSDVTPEALGLFDRVLGWGLLHHLEDAEAEHFFKLANAVLHPGGMVITIDPCYVENQNPIARYMISRDRGQNVRYPQEYRALARHSFASATSTIVENGLRMPYNHHVLRCSKAD